MKKFLVLLLVCVLVFSIMTSLTSCWWKKNKQDPSSTDTPSTDGGNASVDAVNGTQGGTVVLPEIPVQSNDPNLNPPTEE